MKDETGADSQATRAMPTASHGAGEAALKDRDSAAASGSGRLEVRCPNCHAPTEVAVDTTLTDLTCTACGSHFSLVDQSKATRMAPSLTKMGRFDLIERIGIGGFGSVWKGRDKELDRAVAIKIPRQTAMSGDEQTQFFREARAAAQLRHPNIVSVHEVGRDGDSVYIVSDFVRGVTLGDWLTGQKLTSREAAELCVKVADALHHAHEQGVVHRDLKPANIMMDYDGEPHLMDFGLARRESGEVSITMDGQVLGTPAYMSPEQAQGEAHTADRRSDVYSLGVILFQLLTGELPFRGNARMLIKQVIQDEPPSPRKLNSNVSKDLETITLKCLEKDPNRRYRTALELEAELNRFLSGEPIQARPLNNASRAIRWIQRNKTVAALSTAVALALLGGAIVSAYFAIDARRQAAVALSREKEALESKQQAEIARRDAEERQKEALKSSHQADIARRIAEDRQVEALDSKQKADAARRDAVARQKESEKARSEEARARKESEAVIKFLVKAFGSPAPGREGRTVTVAEILDRAEKDLEKGLADQPLAQAALLQAIGESRMGLGLWHEAVPPLERAKTLREASLGAEHSETLASMESLGRGYGLVDRDSEAAWLYARVLAVRQKKSGPNDPATLTTMLSLAHYYPTQTAIGLLSQIVNERRKQLGDDDPATLAAIEGLAGHYRRAGMLEKDVQRKSDFLNKAIELHKEVLAKRQKAGHAGSLVLNSMAGLAGSYYFANRLNEAIDLYVKTIAAQRETLGSDHPDTLKSMNVLATAYSKAGRTKEAISLYEETVAGLRARLGNDHWSTVNAMRNLAKAYLDSDRLDEAVRLYEEGFATARKWFGLRYAITGELANSLIKIHLQRGNFEKAISISEQSLSDIRKSYGDNSRYTQKAFSDLAKLYERAGIQQPKVKLFEQLDAAKETESATLNEAAWMLATSPVDAIRDGKRAVGFATKACELTEYADPNIVDTLAAACAEAGDFESAVKWSEKSLALVSDDDNMELRETLSRALEHYKAKKPIRDPEVEPAGDVKVEEAAKATQPGDSQPAAAVTDNSKSN